MSGGSFTARAAGARPIARFGWIATLACSCGDGDTRNVGDEPQCPGKERKALIAGTSEETYLGIAEPQRRAIVELVDRTASSDAFCTGTFVTPIWVVSAAHCLVIPSLAVRIQGSAQGRFSLVPVVHAELHEGVDLALLRVDFTAADAAIGEDGSAGADGAADALDIGLTPIPASAPDLRLDRGDAVELAGFGLNDRGVRNELAFLVESISEIDASSFSVDGFGVTGACEGDSGGPLLVRSNGALVVAGALSTGEASCTGVDRYVRLDTVSAWIQSITDTYTAGREECGAFGAEGRCLYGAALFCEGGLLSAEACTTGPGRQCGWDSERQGFRCVDTARDACSGVDAVGACRGSTAATCSAGTLVAKACAPCGACRVDGRTGSPYCASAP